MPEVPLRTTERVFCRLFNVILGDGDAAIGTAQQFVAVPHHEL